MQEKALKYFEKNPLLFADMRECIKKGDAEVVLATENGVILRDVPSDIYSFACDSAEEATPFFEAVRGRSNRSGWLVAHGQESQKAVVGRYAPKKVTVCYQVVYESARRHEYDEGLSFKAADERELPRIVAEYDLESPENLEKLCKAKKIVCAYRKSDGAFVGFIGRHPEGSMGLLLIFPDYRRHGYAFSLEGKLIDLILDEGRLPYAHIIEDNEKSLALQKKLGFSIAQGKVYWNKTERL